MQEVIVYRNPVEAAFYKSLMSAEGFILLCAFVTFWVVFAVLYNLWVKKVAYREQNRITNISLSLSSITAIIVIVLMARSI